MSLTKDEIRRKLVGYMKIHKKFWSVISHSRHVRYITSDGKFKVGGFIMKTDFVKDINGHKQLGILLQSNFKEDKVTWFVPYNNIKYIYAKACAIQLSILEETHNLINKVMGNVKILNEKINKLRHKIASKH